MIVFLLGKRTMSGKGCLSTNVPLMWMNAPVANLTRKMRHDDQDCKGFQPTLVEVEHAG